MKSRLLIIILAIILGTSTLHAEIIRHVHIGDLYYNLDTEKKTAEVTYKLWNRDSFSKNQDWTIQSVHIPATIKHKNIFYYVTSVGEYAFDGCTSLTSISIPNSVTSIGSYAFHYCKNLTSITIPNSITNIGSGAFYNCYSLTSITIPNSVTNIGIQAFSGCENLTSINIPNSVTSMLCSFFECDNLPIIDNLRYADTYLVNVADTSLSTYSIKEGTRWIPSHTFRNCENLTSITIPNSVTSIGEGAFYNCSELTSVTIDNGVDSIGSSVFSGCKNLTYITIPNSVTSIGYAAFYGCNNLPIINNLRYADTYLVNVADKTLSTYSIREGTRWLGKYAFKDCENLTSITIPNSVTNIEEGAFAGCFNLTSISIPSNVSSIGDAPFRGCFNLTSINVAANNQNYCSDNGVLFDKNKTTLIQYPMGKSENSYHIPSSVTRIGYGAFWNCNDLTSITIPNSVTSIGDRAFIGCYKLTNIIIQNGVTYIGDEAFDGCENLTSITIPNSVTSIGGSAFSGCTGLTNITIPNSVTSIGDGAFYGCENLTSITIPNSVTSIGWRAFAGCENLTSIAIPNSVIQLGSWIFENCINLQEIHYPEWMDLSKAGIPSSTHLIKYTAQKPNNMPLLALADDISFTDATGNSCIDSEEQCDIRFLIQNKGKGDAKNCEARVSLSGAKSGISVQTVKLPTIEVGDTYEVEIPVTSDINTQDGQVTFSVEVYEPNGWGVEPFAMNVTTKAYEAPFLKVVDYNITSESGKIRKADPFTINFNLQNIHYGEAEQVKVKIILPEYVYSMGETEFSFPSIKSGESKTMDIELAINRNYSSENVPVTISIQEKHGKYAEDRTLNIALNQTTSSHSINIAAKPDNNPNRGPIQIASLRSDVDKDIPETGIRNDNTFVLIIANEHYNYVERVPFAINDGNIFKEYCIKTLGINKKQIQYIPDATGGMIRSGINKLRNISETFDNPHIIVYYAGHGIPDESNNSAHLLPVDGSATDVKTGYKLDDLYATLGKMPASQITVFMDACFSGSKREDGMLVSARSVVLKAKSGVPQGKMVVFSAAQGDETAYPNREQQHGMFTYYLLKKLKETEGDITLKDLGDYVTKQVRQQSLLLNDKQQTPCVTPSAEVAQEWQAWTLK